MCVCGCPVPVHVGWELCWSMSCRAHAPHAPGDFFLFGPVCPWPCPLQYDPLAPRKIRNYVASLAAITGMDEEGHLVGDEYFMPDFTEVGRWHAHPIRVECARTLTACIQAMLLILFGCWLLCCGRRCGRPVVARAVEELVSTSAALSDRPRHCVLRVPRRLQEGPQRSRGVVPGEVGVPALQRVHLGNREGHCKRRGHR